MAIFQSYFDIPRVYSCSIQPPGDALGMPTCPGRLRLGLGLWRGVGLDGHLPHADCG